MSTTPSGSRLVSAVTRRSQKGRVCVLSRWGARIQRASRSRKRQASTSGRTSETRVSATLRCSAPGCSQGTLCAISTAVAAMRWRARRRMPRRLRRRLCCPDRAALRALRPAQQIGRAIAGLIPAACMFSGIVLIVHPARHFTKQLRTWRLRPTPGRCSHWGSTFRSSSSSASRNAGRLEDHRQAAAGMGAAAHQVNADPDLQTGCAAADEASAAGCAPC